MGIRMIEICGVNARKEINKVQEGRVFKCVRPGQKKKKEQRKNKEYS